MKNRFGKIASVLRRFVRHAATSNRRTADIADSPIVRLPIVRLEGEIGLRDLNPASACCRSLGTVWHC